MLWNKNFLYGFLLAVFGAILFSTKAILVKLAFLNLHIDVVSLLFLRMLFSLPVYVVTVWVINYRTQCKSLTGTQWVKIALMGLMGYYFSSLFDFIGLQYVSAGLERVILFLYPCFVLLINVLVFKQKINKFQILALVLAYTGVFLAFYHEMYVTTNQAHFYFGATMIFLCACTYAVYLVGTGKLLQEVGATRYTALAMLFATAGVFAHFLLNRHTSTIVFSASLMGYAFVLALFATVIPSFLISYGMKRIGSSNVAIIGAIGPVSTIIQAHFLLGEGLSSIQILGNVLVIAGVTIIALKK